MPNGTCAATSIVGCKVGARGRVPPPLLREGICYISSRPPPCSHAVAAPAPSHGAKMNFLGTIKSAPADGTFQKWSVQQDRRTAGRNKFFALLVFMEDLLGKYIGMVLILNGHDRPCRDLNVPEISFPAGAGTPKVAKHIFHERQQTKSAKMLFRLAVLRFC